ncbi:glycosyltransferase family 4 protein [Candidatus Omnitrophota bacterium]
MKISFIEPHLKVYGGVRTVIELANRLIERGHDVTIFHSNGSPCRWLKCSAGIKSYLEALREDHEVIIYNSLHPADHYMVKRVSASLKVFFIFGLYEKQYLTGKIPASNFLLDTRNSLRAVFLKKSLASPCLKLAHSTWMCHWLKQNMNIDVRLVIHGVSFDVFHPVEVKKDPGAIRILCSGDPREFKRTPVITEAMEIVTGARPEVALDTYHGKGIPQEEMAKVYSSADIFLDAQRHGGWNNPVAEAMACKTPVVCTNIGAVQDFAIHEETALLVALNDPGAMASAVLRLIDDKALRERLRENAYRHIGQFGWDRSAKALEEILETELKKKNDQIKDI